MHPKNEQGIALIMTLLIMMLMSALLVGFTAVVSSDQRYRYIDRDRNRAFYGASAGIEKMTADLGNLFLGNVAPTPAQLTTLAGARPTIPLITFTAPTAPTTMPTSSLGNCGGANTATNIGASGYTVRYCADPTGRPTVTGTPAAIKSGPYEGLIAQQMPYQLDVTARTASGGEVHLVRSMEAVAIPVFQFGIFSDTDLSFFAGPSFNFGGRVHTNGNLFLASGSTLTLSQKVTAVKEVVREYMQNNVSITAPPSTHSGTVNMAQAPGVFRALLHNEGSVVGMASDLPADRNEPIWHTTSLSTYNSWIRNGRTGAKRLDLSLILAGGSNIAMIQRPAVSEDVDHPELYVERMYPKASLRILLSDTAADITSLPGVTGAPVSLEPGAWPPAGYTAGTPIARTLDAFTATTTAAVTAGSPKTIPLTGMTVPGSIGLIKITSGASNWFLACTGKTATTVTGCTSSPSHTVSTAAGATVTVTIPPTLTSGPVMLATTTTTATWASGGTTVSFNTSGLPTTPMTVWVGNQSVTCQGPNTDTGLTNCNVPSAIAAGDVVTTGSAALRGTGTIGGWIKIDRGNADGTWSDVTMEILNYGIAAPSEKGSGCVLAPATAIIRLERLRDYSGTACPLNMADASSYWPNALFDTREAIARDTAPAGGLPRLAGVMYYVGIDATNLSNWFLRAGAYAAGTGNLAQTNNGGYTLYFSDRRNNRKPDGTESGEFGYEDFVNPATGAPNGVLDTGEDVNGDGVLQTYGEFPSYNGIYNSVHPNTIAGSDLDLGNARPSRALTYAVAQTNRATLFRRALKLTNGANLRPLGITGLTIVAENPIYVQGNWNAPGAFTTPDVASAVIGDTVTLLSNEWTDAKSFQNPYNPGSRTRTTNPWYRMAIISGKGPTFPWISGEGNDFGTDGGAHNFLRYLEGGGTVNYLGSMATFFFNRQAVGAFKCCNTVYVAPNRVYTFDTNFLSPALLPPNTPMFRDLNAVGFAQELRPGK